MESLVCNLYLGVAARKTCLSRSVPEIHSHVAGTLSNNQPTYKPQCAARHLAQGPGTSIMETNDRQVTTVFTVQPSFHHRHSTNWLSWSVIIVGERALTPHLVVCRRCNASWHSVCRVPMVEWRLDCENCRHLTVVDLHDTGPWTHLSLWSCPLFSCFQVVNVLPLFLLIGVFFEGCFGSSYRPVGQVDKASTSRAEAPGFKSRLRRDFSGSSHTRDLNIGSPVATLPGAWRYRVSVGTGWPGVTILWQGEMESLIRNFYLGVAARKLVWTDPSLRYMLLGR